MVFNPGTIATGASIMIPYYSFPTSMASPTDTTVIQNDTFLVQRAGAYILEMRNDARFQIMEARARETLLQMIDNENNKGIALNMRVKTPEEKKSFRIGRDG